MTAIDPVSRKLIVFAALISLLTPTAAVSETATTETLSLQKIPVQYELDATIEAVQQSTISAQTSGAIKAIHFDVNDPVNAGALLLEIDNIQQLANLSQAKANLAQSIAHNEDAQLLLKRNQRLFKKGTVSRGELDSTNARASSALAAVTAARAQVEQAQEQLSYTQVRAPYAGIVRNRHIEIGELVNPGTPLMTGLSLTDLRAVADIPQRLAKQYRSAEQILVLINGETLPASYVTLFPFADSALHSVRLRAELPPQTTGLIPGMWARVVMKTGERQAITVPKSAVIQRSELSAVYTQRDGKPVLRQVRVGNQYGERIEILSGLSAGDVIYNDGYKQLATSATAVK